MNVSHDLTRDDSPALIFAFETDEIRNEDYRNLDDADTLAASKALGRLRDLGLFEQRGAGSATHYVPTERLLTGGQASRVSAESAQVAGETSGVEEQGAQVAGETSGVEGQSEQARSQSEQAGVESGQARVGNGQEPSEQERSALLRELPEDLRNDLLQLGRRVSHVHLRDLVVRICTVRGTTMAELSTLLERGRTYLNHRHLVPLLREGRIERTEKNPSSPNQKYRAVGRAET